MQNQPKRDYYMASSQYQKPAQWSESHPTSGGYQQGAAMGNQQQHQPSMNDHLRPQQMPLRYSPDGHSRGDSYRPHSTPPPYYPTDYNDYSSQLRPAQSSPLEYGNSYPSPAANNFAQSHSQVPFTPPARFTSPSPNQKIIAIPATAAASGSPFLRAYAQSLASHNISKSTFLTFLDRLNHVQKDSPPLQVLGVAGSIVGFMPFASAQLVSFGIGAASKLGNVAMTKGRTEMMMSESNKQLFEPRGLRVEICKVEAMAKLGGIPMLDRDGNVDQGSSLWRDLNADNADPQRMLMVLDPWVERLEMCPVSYKPSVGSARGAVGALQKFGKFAKERKQKRNSGRASSGQLRAEEDYRKEMDKLYEEERVVMQKESGSRRQQELRKIEREQERVQRRYEKNSGKGQGKTEAALWLVIKEIKQPQT